MFFIAGIFCRMYIGCTKTVLFLISVTKQAAVIEYLYKTDYSKNLCKVRMVLKCKKNYNVISVARCQFICTSTFEFFIKLLHHSMLVIVEIDIFSW